MSKYKNANNYQSLYKSCNYDLPRILFIETKDKESEEDILNNTKYNWLYNNTKLLSIFLLSLNSKIVNIKLINGIIISGTLEYRKIDIPKYQRRSLNYKYIYMIIINNIEYIKSTRSYIKLNIPQCKQIYIPITSILSMTSPEVINPAKYLFNYIKTTTLYLKNHD
ncbi:hypothetical protein ACR3K2_33540 [Cryptosporidium serpentis]